LLGESHNNISSSEYLASFHGIKASSTPPFDLDKEYELQDLVKTLIRNNHIESAHDIADGGLFITLLESAMPKGLGFDITTSAEIREDAFLFGESPSRIVVSVAETAEDAFLDTLKNTSVPFTLLGHVTRGDIRIDDTSFGEVQEYKALFDSALAKHL
jgi:phosphoribosylformylglycinamidine synthase